MGHIQNMMEDQYDYHLYAMRKFTLIAFEALLCTNNDELHRYKHVVKAVIGLCKLALKLSKNKDQELAKFVPEYEAYKASEEYEKLQKNPDGEDDDDYKKDTDPNGYQKYEDMVSFTPRLN